MIWAYLIIGLVALQRLVELPYAARNTKRLLASGAIEYGRKHYPLFVVLHATWLLAIIFALPRNPPIYLAPLVACVALEILRLWVLLSLGPYWTTRIISLPKAPPWLPTIRPVRKEPIALWTKLQSRMERQSPCGRTWLRKRKLNACFRRLRRLLVASISW